jgi:hypothetical protein
LIGLALFIATGFWTVGALGAIASLCWLVRFESSFRSPISAWVVCGVLIAIPLVVVDYNAAHSFHFATSVTESPDGKSDSNAEPATTDRATDVTSPAK